MHAGPWQWDQTRSCLDTLSSRQPQDGQPYAIAVAAPVDQALWHGNFNCPQDGAQVHQQHQGSSNATTPTTQILHPVAVVCPPDGAPLYQHQVCSNGTQQAAQILHPAAMVNPQHIAQCCAHQILQPVAMACLLDEAPYYAHQGSSDEQSQTPQTILGPFAMVCPRDGAQMRKHTQWPQCGMTPWQQESTEPLSTEAPARNAVASNRETGSSLALTSRPVPSGLVTREAVPGGQGGDCMDRTLRYLSKDQARQRTNIGEVNMPLPQRNEEVHMENTNFCKILVPEHCADALMRTEGLMTGGIVMMSNCQVRISGAEQYFPGTNDRICIMGGSMTGLEECLAGVLKKLQDVSGKLSRPFVMKLAVPNSVVSNLIGYHGENVQQLSSETHCRISISPRIPELQERLVMIEGGYDALVVATCRVVRDIQHDPHLREHLRIQYDVELDVGAWTRQDAAPADPHEPLMNPAHVENKTKRELIAYLRKAAPRELLLRFHLLGNMHKALKAKRAGELKDAVQWVWEARGGYDLMREEVEKVKSGGPLLSGPVSGTRNEAQTVAKMTVVDPTMAREVLSTTATTAASADDMLSTLALERATSRDQESEASLSVSTGGADASAGPTIRQKLQPPLPLRPSTPLPSPPPSRSDWDLTSFLVEIFSIPSLSELVSMPSHAASSSSAAGLRRDPAMTSTEDSAEGDTGSTQAASTCNEKPWWRQCGKAKAWQS